MAEQLDGADIRYAIDVLEHFSLHTGLVEGERTRLARAATGLRFQYCVSCGRISEDCSADPCADVAVERAQ